MRDAFRAKGHDAWSCDLEPSDSPYHYQGDVLTILDRDWDLGIFHPPCTYLSNSSSKHLYIDGKKENGVDNERWRQLRLGAQFFEKLWTTKHIGKVACENPIMLGVAKDAAGLGKQTQTLQPWMFGDPEQKATCLWLRELPALVPTYATWDACRTALRLEADAKPKQSVHLAPPGEDRWKMRSLTYQGIANAMADQWG